MQTHLSRTKIRLNLSYLNSNLPKNPTAVAGLYEVPEHLYKAVIESDFSQPSLQEISNHMGYFLGIVKSVKITLIEEASDSRWTVSSSGVVTPKGANKSSPPGLYKALGSNHSEILIMKKRIYDFKHIMAILAHEYTHHYLHLHNVKKSDVHENEILTEIASAYLGLGKYLVYGYERIKLENKYYELGYVNPETIKNAILLSAKVRKWDHKEVVKSFSSWFDKSLASVELWSYRREIKKARLQKERKIYENKICKETLTIIKEELIKLKESYKTIELNFKHISNTVDESVINQEDGIKFVKIADEISLGTVSDKLNYLLSNIENIKISDSLFGRKAVFVNDDGITFLDKEVETLTNHIGSHRDLLNKYMHAMETKPTRNRKMTYENYKTGMFRVCVFLTVVIEVLALSGRGFSPNGIYRNTTIFGIHFQYLEQVIIVSPLCIWITYFFSLWIYKGFIGKK